MTNLQDVVWCQEEPKNNGSWFFAQNQIEDSLTAAGHTGKRPTYAGRDAAASPATGLASRHKAQQEALIAAALGL
jgi:2-oxoglutarate dehydrogenase E1 component